MRPGDASQIQSQLAPPGEYRVDGVLRNIPGFYAAFNVMPGDKM